MYSIVSNKAKASTSRLRTTAALLPLLSLLLVGCFGGDPNAAGSPESAERELFYALLSGDPGVTSYLSASSNKQLDAAIAALGPELEGAAARRAVLAAAGVTLEATLRDGRTVQTHWRQEAGKWVADLSFAPAGGS